MKFIKLTSMILGLFILFIILVAVCLVTFVNPDRLKPLIAEQVKERSGLQLTIDGDISWTLVPYLGIKVGHVILNNPIGFKQKILAEIDQATIGMQLVPLLHKKVELNSIQLEGVTVNLIKNAHGKVNWHFPMILKVKNPTVKQTADKGPPDRNVLTAPFVITVSNVDVGHAKINWIDEQKNKIIHLDQLSLHANNINLLRAYPVTLSFDFNENRPSVRGHVELATQFLPDFIKQKILLQDLHISSELQQKNGSLLPVTASGDLLIDWQEQTMDWSHFKGSMLNVPVAGQLQISHFQRLPELIAELQIPPFDLKATLQSFGYDMTAVQSLNHVIGELQLNVTPFLMNAEGDLKISQAEVNHLKISNLIIPFHYQNGMLDSSPITADFYQGVLEAKVKADVTRVPLQMTVKSKLNNIQTGALLTDLSNRQATFKLNGDGNIYLHFTTDGNDLSTLINRSMGEGYFNLNNGRLEGININHLVRSAHALLKHKSAPTQDENHTEFGNLQGTFQIVHGIIYNNDLVINAPAFSTQGKGNIDLNKKNIHYALNTRLLNVSNGHSKKSPHHSSQTIVPVMIDGAWMSPEISIDAGTLIQQFAIQNNLSFSAKPKLSKKLKKEAGQLLQGLF